MTAEIHEEVSKFLRVYRVIVENERDADVPQQAAFFHGQQENQLIQAALDKPLTAELEDVALTEVIEFIRQAMKIPIVSIFPCETAL